MSEEILKALVQLFAIITKQDNGVTEKERQYVINIFAQKLNKDSVKDYVSLYDKAVGYGDKNEYVKKENFHSVLQTFLLFLYLELQ